MCDRRGVASDNRDPIAWHQANWERSEGEVMISTGMVAVMVVDPHPDSAGPASAALRLDLISPAERLRLLASSRQGATDHQSGTDCRFT